jgi:hypothetical protein
MANKKVSQLTSKPSVLVTDLFPIADPSTGQLYKTTISDLGTAIGSGVSSVNGLVGAVVLDTDDIQELVSPTNKWFTDTRARAALSASSPLAYNSGTGVFSIPASTSSQNGYLTSTDWTTFNSKVSGTGDTGYYARWTSAGVLSDGFIQTDSNITYVAGMGLTTYNGLDVQGNFGAEVNAPKIKSYDETTSAAYIEFINTSGVFRLGIESSTGGGVLPGSTAYATVLTSGLTAKNLEFGTNNTKRLTLDGTTGAATFTSSVTASALYVTGMTAGSGAIYHSGSRLTMANYNASGTLHFEVNGGTGALTLNADTSASFVSTISATGATLTGALSGTSATFSTTIADYAMSVSNVLDSSQGLLVRATDNDGDLYLLRLQSSNGATSQTWVDRFTVAKSGAATFSSSVTAGGTGDGDWFTLNRSTVKKFNINLTSDWTTITSTANRLQLNDYTNTGISINAGNVGIGTTAPTDYSGYTTLHLNGKSGANGGLLRLTAFDASSSVNIYAGGSAINFNTTAAVPFVWLTQDTERMRITSAGNLLVGTTSDNGNKLQVGGYISMIAGGGTGASYGVRFSNNNGAYWEVRNVDLYNKFQFIYQGSVLADINSSNGVYTALSDERKKKDFEESNIGLNEIMRLKPTLFRMKTDSDSVSKQLGFIAQQVQSVIPQACDSVGDFIGVQDRPILAGVVKAIQELKAELDALKA